MSRSFSILLIALGLAILGSLVYLHFHLMERQHQATFAEASQISQTAISQKMDRMKIDIRLLKRSMVEWGAEYQLPILTVVERAAEERENLLNELFPRGVNPSGNYLDEKRWIKPISDYHELANVALNKLDQDCRQLFETRHSKLDLSEDDAQERAQAISARIEKFVQAKLDESRNRPEDYSRALLALDFLNQQESVLKEIIQLAGHKAMVIDQYFPIMTLGPEQPIVGENVTATLIAGAFSGKLFNSEIRFIVGQDTLTADANGTARYSFKAGRQGLHTLPTKCIVTTPLTGNVVYGKGEYTYRSY